MTRAELLAHMMQNMNANDPQWVTTTTTTTGVPHPGQQLPLPYGGATSPTPATMLPSIADYAAADRLRFLRDVPGLDSRFAVCTLCSAAVLLYHDGAGKHRAYCAPVIPFTDVDGPIQR